VSGDDQVLRVRARPLRGHPTLTAALAYRHPLLPRAENDTKLLAGGGRLGGTIEQLFVNDMGLLLNVRGRPILWFREVLLVDHAAGLLYFDEID
jgi:hypothetical protein